MQIIGPATVDLDIRPMEADQKFEAFSTLMEHTKMMVYEPPHAPAGVRMCLDAIWQNNVETLSCAGYNHNWVRVYTFETMRRRCCRGARSCASPATSTTRRPTPTSPIPGTGRGWAIARSTT